MARKQQYEFEDELDSDRRNLPGEGPYPAFKYVAGAPGLGIGEKFYIDSGEEPKRSDALDHLFPGDDR